ncbi:acyl-CoA dehydrogenase [Kriegella sp. EG-1]|nr:acyl-CoA dehydrogenase [Flavobacteriaceae bacterium EG-1]
MDFSWNEEQLEFKKRTIKFAQNELCSNVLNADKTSQFSTKDWKKCVAYGIQKMASIKPYGGAADKIDLLSATLAMEAMGYGCKDNGLPFALNAQMWTVQMPIVQFGSKLQKEKYLNGMATGKLIGCHGLTEENAGSDVFSMQTTATKVEGGYILNGKKCYITLGPIADIAVIFASTNPKVGKWGITGFIVEKGMKGFSQSSNKEKMGMRTVPFGDLMFDDCFVPDENLLGKEGAGWAITSHTLEYDRCCILASQLGAMERQLEESIAFVKKRKQFGKSIGEFQSVSNRIADMKLRLETSRLLLYQVAWLKNQDKPAMMEAALLKLQLSESFVTSSLDAMRNNGGRAYLSENEIERNLRDAVGSILYAGTSDIQRNIIANLLGL